MEEDRRVRHTKKRIREALLDCLVTGSLDKVTVKKIYEIADINRTTFYAHYYDPYILYEQIEKEVIDGLTLFLANFQDRTMDYEKLLECLLLYFSEYSREFLMLTKTNSVSFRKAFIDQISKYDFLPQFKNAEDIIYAQDYYINGVLSVVTRWLAEGQKKSITEMVSLIVLLTGKDTRR